MYSEQFFLVPEKFRCVNSDTIAVGDKTLADNQCLLLWHEKGTVALDGQKLACFITEKTAAAKGIEIDMATSIFSNRSTEQTQQKGR
jgi:hypothetical protein